MPNPVLTLEPPASPVKSPKLSLAMIVLDEEDTIERVLGCVHGLCDELIVVDTGSTDRTVQRARACGAQVPLRSPPAPGPQRTAQRRPQRHLLQLPNRPRLDGRMHTFSFLRERLIRRGAGLQWDFPVHECIAIPAGRSIERPDIAVQHRPSRANKPRKSTATSTFSKAP